MHSRRQINVVPRTVAMNAMALLVIVLLFAGTSWAHTPGPTDTFDRAGCTFTSTGSNPYFPLWPGYELIFEGTEVNDDEEVVDLALVLTVTSETKLVDGVMTRVVVERETEDEELVEISRNFFASCRETGDVWYFGEEVDDYEDGEVVGHGGQWLAGENGNEPGILMPRTPLLGARFFTELAPGIALDFSEVVSLDTALTVPFGAFTDVLYIEEGSAVEPDAISLKYYAPGVGLVKDGELELVAITPPPCQPDATTHCLNDGRFKVQVEWMTATEEGEGQAILASADSGEFWFFSSDNTEILVKVLDACSVPGFNNTWVFAAGVTDVGVTISVTDTQSDDTRQYPSVLGQPFAPVLDTAAFDACP